MGGRQGRVGGTTERFEHHVATLTALIMARVSCTGSSGGMTVETRGGDQAALVRVSTVQKTDSKRRIEHKADQM